MRLPAPFSPICSRSISSKLRDPSGKNPWRAFGSGASGNAHSSSHAAPSACVAMRQGTETVLGPELDLVDRLVVGALPLLVHAPGTVDVAVRRPVEFGCVGFERMRAELLDIDSDRGCQPLRAQHVEPRWRAVRVR